MHNANALGPSQADSADHVSRDRQRRGAHELGDPRGERLVPSPHILDERPSNVLAASAREFIREGTEGLDCLREWVDRPGIDENESTCERRVLRGQLDGDHAA